MTTSPAICHIFFLAAIHRTRNREIMLPLEEDLAKQWAVLKGYCEREQIKVPKSYLMWNDLAIKETGMRLRIVSNKYVDRISWWAIDTIQEHPHAHLVPHQIDDICRQTRHDESFEEALFRVYPGCLRLRGFLLADAILRACCVFHHSHSMVVFGYDGALEAAIMNLRHRYHSPLFVMKQGTSAHMVVTLDDETDEPTFGEPTYPLT